jgi:hypothetical protein
MWGDVHSGPQGSRGFDVFALEMDPVPPAADTGGPWWELCKGGIGSLPCWGLSALSVQNGPLLLILWSQTTFLSECWLLFCLPSGALMPWGQAWASPVSLVPHGTECSSHSFVEVLILLVQPGRA